MNCYEYMSDEQRGAQYDCLSKSYNQGVFIDELHGETNIRPLSLSEPEPLTDDELWQQERIRQSIAKERGRQFRASGLCLPHIKERFEQRR